MSHLLSECNKCEEHWEPGNLASQFKKKNNSFCHAFIVTASSREQWEDSVKFRIQSTAGPGISGSKWAAFGQHLDGWCGGCRASTWLKSIYSSQAWCLVPSYGKLSFGFELYCWSRWGDLNLNLALCGFWCYAGGFAWRWVSAPFVCRVSQLWTSLWENLIIPGRFLGGAIKQVSAFFPLGERSVFAES